MITRAIDFVSFLILARILSPSDFGLTSIAIGIILIVEAIMEMPINQALVSFDIIHRDHLDTAFTIGAVRGLILTVVVSVLALPISLIYHDFRIIALLCVLSIAPAARSIQSPAMAHFSKAVDFRRDVAIEIMSKLSALIISLIFLNIYRNYWAIVVNMVATPIVAAAFSYALAPYLPRLSLFHWRKFADFFGWNTAAQLVGALSWQSDRLILGAFVNHSQLGAYSLANDLSALPEQSLVKPIFRPLMSSFAQIKGNPHRLRAAYLEASVMIFTLGLPIMLCLSLLADPLVHFALGAKWLPAIPIMQWLALSLIPPLIYAPIFPLAMAIGKTRLFYTRSLLELAFKAPITFFSVMLNDTFGAITARLITALIMLLISMSLVTDLLSIRLTDQLGKLARPSIAAAIMVAALLVGREFIDASTPARLGLGLSAVTATGFMIYVLVLIMTWLAAGSPDGPERKIIAAFIHLFQKNAIFT